MIKLKPLIISILISFAFGILGTILGGNFNNYEIINRPIFSPPAIIFPIVWTILYTLMGISSYLIYTSDANEIEKKWVRNVIPLPIDSFLTFPQP